MEGIIKEENSLPSQPKWRKVAYGGTSTLGIATTTRMTSFLEGMVMNANVVKRDMLKVMQDSISISQYICIVALVVCVWSYTLGSTISETTLLLLDSCLLGLGFCSFDSYCQKAFLHLLLHYLLNIAFFISWVAAFSPLSITLTKSISSDSIWALTVLLLLVHLFLHDYSGSIIRPPGALTNPTLTSNISLTASIVASVLIASRLPSRLPCVCSYALFPCKSSYLPHSSRTASRSILFGCTFGFRLG
ncbi:hypothetical protein Scep_015040 [Stephania cephalantha]|uniref:Uncharacterized protein n=1 Tax=Stephania cephalantha TaxID=152367 RepID=A0AAP0J2E5_9MAGN